MNSRFKKPGPATSRKADTSTLKECIDDLLEYYRLKGKFNETHVIASWERIMGKPIANRTLRLFIKNKVMYVTLNSAPLKQELSLSKSKVLALLHADLGEEVLTDIVFL